MSTPEPIVDNDVDNTDLDAFNNLFHGKVEETPEDDGPKDDPVEDDDAVDAETEQTEETHDDGDDTPATEEEEEEEPKPEPKLSPTQKRINQLLEKARLAEDRAKAAEAKLNERTKDEAPAEPKPKKVEDNKAPRADDLNEDGTDKYPLGQFDEAFQEDRFNYMIEKSLAEQKAALEKQAQEAEIRRSQEALNQAWNEKLDPARERYPDFQEKGEELLDTFSGLDQEYGQYLTTTIMGMEYGPDVLYHLSNNLAEAERIVKLGPLGATIALGRIEARFLSEEAEKPKPRPKVSKAPAPPPRNKGSNAAIPEVPDDTDDLDAFSAKLFKKG